MEKKNYKPFDLELAKKGHPVQTMDGRKVRIVCFDVKTEKYALLALIEENGVERSHFYTDKGEYVAFGKDPDLDLVMAPIKKEGWINLYESKSEYVTEVWAGSDIFDTEADAIEYGTELSCAKEEYLTTIKIAWKE